MIIMLLMMLYNDNSNNKNVILVDWMSVCAFRRPHSYTIRYNDDDDENINNNIYWISVCAFRRPLSDADFWYKVLKFGLTGQPRSRKLYFVSTLWYARKLVHATTAEGEKKSGIGAGRFSREKKNILIHTHTHTHTQTHKHTHRQRRESELDDAPKKKRYSQADQREVILCKCVLYA